jgi:hypothetical protein
MIEHHRTLLLTFAGEALGQGVARGARARTLTPSSILSSEERLCFEPK